MNIAIAVCKDQLALTLGQAEEFVLLSKGKEERFFCKEKIPLFLKKHEVQLLVCNRIGNCMLDLLSTMGIEVIAGVEGELDSVRERLATCTLEAGEHYSCTDHGQSCGACAGTF